MRQRRQLVLWDWRLLGRALALAYVNPKSHHGARKIILRKPSRFTAQNLVLALAVTTSCIGVAGAQIPATPADAKDTAEMLKAIDQLTEQNRQLEKQNQQLMDQITVLRQTLAEHQGSTQSTGAPSPGSSAAPKDSPVEINQARAND